MVCAVWWGRGAQGAAAALAKGVEGTDVVQQLVKEPRALVDLSDFAHLQAWHGGAFTCPDYGEPGRADSSLSRSMEGFPGGLPVSRVSGLADPRTRLGALLFQAKQNFWKVCAVLHMHMKCNRALTSENICGGVGLSFYFICFRGKK